MSAGPDRWLANAGVGPKDRRLKSHSRADFLKDSGAGAGADAGGSGLDHFLEVVERADAARGFYADVRAYYGAHESDVFDGGAGGAEAGAGFYEVGAGGGGETAGADFFFFGEKAGFDDYFADGVACVGGVANGADVCGHSVVLRGL